MKNSINKMHIATWQSYVIPINKKDYLLNSVDLLYITNAGRCKFLKKLYKVNSNMNKMFKGDDE